MTFEMHLLCSDMTFLNRLSSMRDPQILNVDSIHFFSFPKLLHFHHKFPCCHNYKYSTTHHITPLIAMSGPGDFDHLSGTQVSFDTPSPQVWVLDEKISEDFQTRTQFEVDNYGSRPYAALKFACHNAANERGFMRIYIQIPITGTIARGSRARAQQATQRTHKELEVRKILAEQGCSVVPRLLAYNVGQQDDDDDGCVPGGYFNHIVWARVPGEPIDEAVFWDRDRPYRDKIRDQFRKVYA